MLKKILSKGKTKLLILFLTSLIASLSILAPVAHAQDEATGTWYNQSYNDWWLKVYGDNNPNEIFGERYTAAQVQWIIYSLFAFISNSAMNQNIMTCVMTNDLNQCKDILTKLNEKTSEVTQQNNQVAVQNGPGIIEQIFTDRPLSGISYFKNVARKFSLIPEAKAQTGFGFTALDPILDFWKGTRDISYALLILVTIAFAFMIMFRVKLSPQTVVTVQSALPKLAITIVLVTFSYAIAGLLIDLMYVVIGLGSLLFSKMVFSTIATTPVAIFNWLTKGQPTGFNTGIGFIGLFILYLVFFAMNLGLIIASTIGGVLTLVAGAITAVGLAVIISVPGLNVLFGIIGIILVVIFIVIIVVMMFKIWWMLVKAFVNVLLLTVFAPLHIMIGTILPNFEFSVWLKNIISNLAVFVATGFLFLLSFVFLAQSLSIMLKQITLGNIFDQIIKLLFGTMSYTAGEYPAGWPPLLSGSGGPETTAFLLLATSFVIFTVIPKAGQLVESLFAGKPFAYGTGIGEALGPARAIGQTAAVGYTRVRPTTGLTSLLKTFGVVK